MLSRRGFRQSVVGGFLVSALGGSRFQIGGPARAFIVLFAATVSRFALEGLLLTVLVRGAIQMVIGASRLGSLIRHIPHAVTVGFICGIAVTILASQLRNFSAITLGGPEPGPLVPKLAALGEALPTISTPALAVGLGSAALTFFLRAARPNWPGMLLAVGFASLTAHLSRLPFATIGSRFGEFPHILPTPRLPPLSWGLLIHVLPTAFSFTMLGEIESLLPAKVAESMSGRKHRANMELVAQGIANMASAMFRDISVADHARVDEEKLFRGR